MIEMATPAEVADALHMTTAGLAVDDGVDVDIKPREMTMLDERNYGR
jgi:hypothetical protein